MSKTQLFHHYTKLCDALLHAPVAKRPFWVKAPVKAAQLVYALIRDFAASQVSLRAMSLVYTTLITLVPLLALSFSVLKGFGVHNQIEPALLNMLEGLGPQQSQEITARIISFVNNIKVGVLGIVGLGLLIYMVISLMQKIESAFNFIWRVARARNFAERVGDYLTALFVGPLFIFLSTGLTATARHTELITRLESIAVLGPAFDIITVIIPWLILAMGFAALYIYMPNTKVKFGAAFIGGLSAAILWKVLGLVFAVFMAQSSSNVAIYAAFATLITFMIWIYLSWSVILIGSSIAFYVQNPHYIKIKRGDLALSPRMQMLLAFGCVEQIGKAFHKGNQAPTSEQIAKALNVPIIAVQNVADLLENGGIVMRSGDGQETYYPACPYESTPMSALFDVIESGYEKGVLTADKMKQPASVKKAFGEFLKARNSTLGSKTILKALCL